MSQAKRRYFKFNEGKAEMECVVCRATMRNRGLAAPAALPPLSARCASPPAQHA